MIILIILSSLAFLFLSFCYAMAFINLFPANIFSLVYPKMFLIGTLVGIVFWKIFGKKLNFFAVFEHELTHILVGLIFLQKPKGLLVGEKSGATYIGGNFFVTLAPYYFPTFSYLMLPLYFIIKPSFYLNFFVILGFITGYHIISTIQEAHPRQPDLLRHSLAFSYSFSLFGNIIFLGYLFYFSVGEGNKAFLFLKNGFFVLKSILFKIF